MIVVKNLYKKYGTNEVLNNINIEFAKGKVYGIVGENGAGKTTLFRCISDLEEYEGEINSNPNPVKNHLGLLITEPFFFQKITGTEYIQFLCNARNVKITNIEERNIFELPLNQYASTYSTGMKKKLALTAILLQGNEYFILDEPFSGLDPLNANLIKDEIYGLAQRGSTIIFSTHRMEQVEEICDHIILMNLGKKILDGTVTDVKQQFKENKFNVQFKGQPTELVSPIFTIEHQEKQQLIVKINEGYTSNHVLNYLLQQDVLIERFNEILPSLNDIFIHLVEGSKATTRAFQNN